MKKFGAVLLHLSVEFTTSHARKESSLRRRSLRSLVLLAACCDAAAFGIRQRPTQFVRIHKRMFTLQKFCVR